MKTAAIYCRVSTDNQEAEGTSLQTQLEACREYCQGRGYDVAYRYSEAYSGLTLDRPQLNELRELVRNEQIDVVVVYCLDRLSRNATHGVIIRDEFDKHHVILESVTEDIDKTPLGEAITYLRGTFSQIEAEKIRERTMRGKRAKAKEGRISCGGAARLYGYDYIKVSQVNGGRRVINDIEASWVRKIYQWLVNDGLSTSAITYRLRDLNAPTKHNRLWCRAAVINILKNPAYTGHTYAFTTTKGKRFTRPKEDWIEIDGVTPAIISQEQFEAAQKQLLKNRQQSPRNVKNQYLLRGHIRCRRCGRAYYGCLTKDRFDSVRELTRRYRCSGKFRMVEPLNRCTNRSWKADILEAKVWAELEGYLSNRDLIMSELEKQHHDANQLGAYEAELQQIERQFKAVGREQHQLLQWALKDFPADQVEAENRRLNKAKETLTAQKAALEAQFRASQDASINISKLEAFIEQMQNRLPTLDFEGKRLALDMLGITVWLDGQTIEVTGTVDPENAIVTTQS